ncbi:hypothetical protein D3C87_1608080 [compost metagenome]
MGHSCTQARQVVQAHNDSAASSPGTMALWAPPLQLPTGRPGMGLPAYAASDPPAMPTTMSWISFLGFKGWPAAYAGQAASHLPHCTQASKLSSWFQAKDAGLPTPKGADAGSASNGSGRKAAFWPGDARPNRSGRG